MEVVIIESRSADDHFHQRQEGRTLKDTLKLQGVEARYYEVLDKDHLVSALQRCAGKNVKYVHFSCHGHEEGLGIYLTKDGFIRWDEFHELAWPYLRGRCVVFSSCCVAKGVDKVYEKRKTFCSAIVAPTRAVNWSEALVAYAVFYHRAGNEDSSLQQDIQLMNKVTKPRTFKMISSPAEVINDVYVLGK